MEIRFLIRYPGKLLSGQVQWTQYDVRTYVRMMPATIAKLQYVSSWEAAIRVWLLGIRVSVAKYCTLECCLRVATE